MDISCNIQSRFLHPSAVRSGVQPMSRVNQVRSIPLQRFQISLFEKVILVNSLLIIGGALACLWVTSGNLESHHYLIDTSFIVAITVISLGINVLLMRASFRP